MNNVFVAGNRNALLTDLTTFKPKDGTVFVTDMSFDAEETSTGIVMGNDDGTTAGIRPRWAKVWKVGKNVTICKVGQWVLIDHGRWTRDIRTSIDGAIASVRMIDVDSVFLVSDTKFTSVEEMTMDDLTNDD